MLRLIGIGTVVGLVAGWGAPSRSIVLFAACVVAAMVSIGAAWVATKTTDRIARAKSEALLFAAYVGTFLSIAVAGAAAGLTCRHLLASI